MIIIVSIQSYKKKKKIQTILKTINNKFNIQYRINITIYMGNFNTDSSVCIEIISPKIKFGIIIHYLL